MKAIAKIVVSVALLATVFTPTASYAAEVTHSDPGGDAPSTEDIVNVTAELTPGLFLATIEVAGSLPDFDDPSWGHGGYLGYGRTFHVGLRLDTIAPTFSSESVNNQFLMVVNGDGAVVVNGRGEDFGCDAEAEIYGQVLAAGFDPSCLGNPGIIDVNVLSGTRDSDFHFSGIDFTNSFTVAEPGGYWVLGKDGGVFTFGTLDFYGSTGNLRLNAPVVAMSAMPDALGYRFVANDGGVFSYGSASSKFYGSMGGRHLNAPIVSMATTQTGNGYWLVASDGGVFAYGDAGFYGSMGGKKLNKPIIGITPSQSGNGYQLVASDGGVFSFGDADFYGSLGSSKLGVPVVGLATIPGGYYMVTSTGEVFPFGDAEDYGSGVGDFDGTVTGIQADENGYRLVDTEGSVGVYGYSLFYGDFLTFRITPNQPVVDITSPL